MTTQLASRTSLGALNAVTTPTFSADATMVAVQVVISAFTGTLTFEASCDGGTTYVAFALTPAGGGAVASTATAAGLWTGTIGAVTDFRVRCSAYTSGSAVVHVVTAA